MLNILKRTEAKSDKSIAVAAVGRHLHLGMMYDCRNDSFVPGVYLWDMESIEKNKVVSERPQTFVNISLSDSLEEKTKLLQISSSLSASVYAGLVKIAGSSTYLNDRSSSTRECRATIQYHVMTRTEHLNLSQMGKRKSVHKLSATHVITGVEYGAEALMVFSETASTQTEKKAITSNLNTMLNKISLFEVNAEGKLQMTDEDKKKVQNFSCTFYGDFDLEENPTNFEQAVKVYRDLPKMLGSNKEKAVPKKFWLVPLSEVMSSAPKLKHEVSEINCIKLRNIMEQLSTGQTRANDISKESNSIQATDITKRMKVFQENIEKYILVWKDNLFRLLPEIRKGAEKEDKLEKMFKLHADSPFGPTKMDNWLKERETELSIIRSYINDIHVPDVQMIAPEDLDKIIFDPSNKSVWAFVFTSLGEDDPYLGTLSTCLLSESFTKMERYEPPPPAKEKTPWYKSSEVSKSMRESLKLFCKGAADRHLPIISYINYPYNAGAAVRLYTNCHLDYVNYQNKHEPEVVEVDSSSITIRRSAKTAALPITYKKDGDKAQEQKLNWAQGEETMVISDLQPSTKYEFRVGKHNSKYSSQIRATVLCVCVSVVSLVEQEAAELAVVPQEEPGRSRGEPADEKGHLRGHFCPQCGKSFSQIGHFNVHLKIHSGKKPHQCSHCERSFRTSDQLSEHMHTHSEEKPHRCGRCGKGFTRPGRLRTHERTHTGEKPHGCTECGRSFKSTEELKTHLRVHSGLKPHFCFWCGKGFSRSGHLKKHTFIHTGEKPHSCSECGRRFSRADHLKKHLEIHSRGGQGPTRNVQTDPALVP
ncbi:hypothetical protein NFI96_007244 [Prochilodus magdalenae]|nr:hypothetical protein NFI96_007244 [Prochilodus magdalenae]